MATSRELPDDFLYFLKRKDSALVDTFIDLRSYIISIYPKSNELLYHTHALTAILSQINWRKASVIFPSIRSTLTWVSTKEHWLMIPSICYRELEN